MKFHHIVLALLFLVSCQSQIFQGTLEVSQDLKLGNETIQVGEYSTRISITGKRKLEIKVIDGTKKTTVEVRTKDDIKTYIKNDMINIPAKRSNQDFDIAGTFIANSVMGQKKRDYESCTYQEPYTVCVPNGRRGGVSCHTEYRTRNGYRDVEFKLKTTTTDMKVAMHAPNDPNNYYADYEGVNVMKQRIYSYEGFCR
jgi:hypothetical protein